MATREFLVTKIVCGKCGEVLELTPEPPISKNDVRHCEGEGAGGWNYVSLVGVEPCRKCSEPLREMERAVESMRNLIFLKKEACRERYN